MAPTISKKRKLGGTTKQDAPRTVKRSRKQAQYDSNSSEAGDASIDGVDFAAVDLGESEEEHSKPANGNKLVAKDGKRPDLEQDSNPESNSESADSDSEVTGDSSGSESSQPRSSKKRKRNDPEAFATSMNKILGSKLSTLKRVDPVLARSKTALEASQELSNSRLEAKAKHKLREERKAQLDKGRVRDVLGLDRAVAGSEEAGGAGESVGELAEQERRLRKTAQRGVVKLFNAVRAAQVKAEEAIQEARKEGVVGVKRREERATEMSKKGFLELIGGAGGKGKIIEEA